MLSQFSPLTGILIGLVIGIILTSAFSHPRVARAIGKIVSVCLMAIGGGCLTWGLLVLLSRGEYEPLQAGPVIFYTPAQILGWGAGALAGGITALVLALVSKGPPPKRP